MIEEIFKKQYATMLVLRKSSTQHRIEKLKALKSTIQLKEAEIFNALKEDLRKNAFEAALTEIYFVYGEIDFAIKNLRRWTGPKKISKALSSMFSTNRIHYEPKGRCLIIAPWNYPFQLTMSPLVSAIAAGNTVVIKPSELSPKTAKIINEIVSTTFPTEEIACIEGGVEDSEFLLSLPFDHIFFTGSTEIGKVVMKAASKNLSSVTLELGGKSPAVLMGSSNVRQAAEKIAWGKLTNSGQTCIAPDYLFIERSLKDKFVALYKEACEKMYFSNGQINREVFGKIINKKHFDRLQAALTEAVEGGAQIDYGGGSDVLSNTIFPTIISNCPASSKLLTEEIFGPVLPIIIIDSVDDAIAFINERPKPLASYIFTESETEKKTFIESTSAGGTCVNDVLIHISNPNLPFGGAGASGMGSSHGFYGFKAFSHERSVVYQSKLNLTKLIYPPYNKPWILKIMKKLF